MTDQLVLQVGGMTCTGCESRIEKVLGRLDGVRSAAADRRSGEVRALFAPEQISPRSIGAAITEAGYEIRRDLEDSR